MLIVVCLDLEDGIEPVRALAGFGCITRSNVTLLHIVDTAERTTLEDAMRPGLVRPAIRDVEESLDADEREMLRSAHEQAATILEAAGAGEVKLNVGTGRPERVILSYLSEANADLCVVGRRPDWHENSDIGPRSVGKVARFVIDHAPCPMLVHR